MMSMDCIIWLEDEEGGNEVEEGKRKNTTKKTCYGKQLKTTEKLVIQNSWEENCVHQKTVEKITLKLILFFYIKPFCKFHGLKPVLFFVFVKSLRISLFKVQSTLHVIVDSYRYCNSVIEQTWFLPERKGSRTKGSSAN